MTLESSLPSGARPYLKMSTVLPVVAVAMVLIVAIRLKAGHVVAALGWRSPPAAAPATSTPGETSPAVAEERPNRVRLTSAATVHTMGLATVPVETRSVARTITSNGHVSFNENRYAHIRCRVDGIVQRIGFDVGAEVKAGDVLAVVDSPLLGDMKATFINALTKRDQLEYEFNRLSKLAATEAVPIKTLRETESLYEQQQTSTANTRQQLVNLGFSSEQLDLMVEAKDTSTALAIVAPWDGVIVSRHAVEGELVERNHQLFAIADLKTMWVYLNLYEGTVNKVKLGQSVTFDVDGLPEIHFPGQVEWISPEVDIQTRTTLVRALVKNTDDELRANMFGKGHIVIQSSHDSMAVPEQAVQKLFDDKLVVFVQESPLEFVARPVQIGIRGDDFSEVLEGLEPGERVVTEGSFLLKSDLESDQFGEAQ